MDLANNLFCSHWGRPSQQDESSSLALLQSLQALCSKLLQWRMHISCCKGLVCDSCTQTCSGKTQHTSAFSRLLDFPSSLLTTAKKSWSWNRCGGLLDRLGQCYNLKWECKSSFVEVFWKPGRKLTRNLHSCPSHSSPTLRHFQCKLTHVCD